MKKLYNLLTQCACRTLFLHKTTLLLLIALGLFGLNESAWAGNTWTANVGVGVGNGSAVAKINSDAAIGSGVKSTSAAATSTITKQAKWSSTLSSTKGHAIFEATASDGYSFDAWYTNTACTSGKAVGNPYTTPSSKGGTYTYYAKFTPNQYTITLNKQSGSGGTNSITATYDASTNLTGGIETPSRSGYVFKGYYTQTNGNGTQLIDANGNVLANRSGYTDGSKHWVNAGDVTLYAFWKAKYTISFNAHGGSAASSKEVISGEQYGTLPTTTRTGYTFAGWFTAETGGTQVTNTTTVSITANQTLHAHWLAHYSVAFHANGGNGSMAAQSFIQGTAQNLKENTFTRTGYTFAGWATSDDGNVVYEDKQNVNNLSSTGNATVNLYAKWTANTYYVSFNGNGNTSGSMSNQTFSYDETKNLSSNAYAKSYTVSFDGNSGTPASSKLTATAPFQGWATTANGDKVYNDKQSVSNLTITNGATFSLFAKWGVGTITLPSATRSAYHLEGWYNGDNKVGDAGQAYTPTSNVTLVAHWTQSQLATSFSGSNKGMNVGDAQNNAFVLNNAPNAQAHISITSIDDVTDGSGKVIEYNAATNTITARNAGVATIYFTQDETDEVTGGTSATWTYTVTKKDPSFSGSAYNGLKVDDVQIADYNYSNVSASAPSASSSDAFYYTVDEVVFTNASKNKGADLVTYNPSTKEIKACNAGTGKITLHQRETYKYNAGSKSFDIKICKYDPSFDGSAYNNLMVEGVQTVDYSYSNTSAAKPSASSSDAFYYTIDVTSFANESLNKGTNLATYDAASNTLTPTNAGTGSVTLHQSETYKYNALSQSFGITIGKWANAIYVKGNSSYSGSTTLAGVVNGVTLTATNTDYTNSPFEVEQTAGEDIAVFDKTAQTITAVGKTGTAVWSVHQDENYKYLEADNTFSVQVTNASEATDCYVLNEPTQRTSTNTFNLNGKGKTLYIDFRRSWGDTSSKIKIIGISSNGEEEIDSPSWDDNWTRNKSYDISSKNYTQIKIQLSGGLNTKYYENLKVTRKTYLNASDITIDKTANNLPIYPGESDKPGVGTLKVDYSLANGGDLKIYSDNPKFTLNKTTITGIGCNAGSEDISIEYRSNEAGDDVANLVIYNDVYRKEVKVTGKTVLAAQTITWNYDMIRNGQEVTDATTAPNLVTYHSEDDNIIQVLEDANGNKTILKGVGVGTVKIIATAAGDSYYAETTSEKTIEVTDKQVQTIVWNQSLMGLKLGGSNVPLIAAVTSDVEGCNSTRTITYTSANPKIAEIVNGNELKINAIGSTVITAVQEGGEDSDGHDYAPVSAEKTVIVRDPNAPCESYVYEQSSEVKFDLGWNALNKQTKYSSEISFGDKTPDICTIRYKGEAINVWLDYYAGTMTVEQYVDGWSTVRNLGTPAIGEYHADTFPLNPAATKIRIKVSDGMGYHYFTDCRVSQARFINNTTTPEEFVCNAGQNVSQTISFNYSNLTDGLTLTFARGVDSHFSVNKDYIAGECGSYKNGETVTVSYNPAIAESNIKDTLIITDGTTTCRVPLLGSATALARHIEWNIPDNNEVNTLQTITLNAAALTGAGDAAGEVTYALDAQSTTGTLSNGVLSFTKDGTAIVKVNSVADNRYSDAAEVTKTFVVSKTPTQVTVLPIAHNLAIGHTVSTVSFKTTGEVKNTYNNAVVSGTFAAISGDVSSIGDHEITVRFTPENIDLYATCETNIVVSVVTTTFTADGDWSSKGNWNTGVAPVDNDDVIINADVKVVGDVEVNDIIIRENKTVTVADGASLTINGSTGSVSSYGNIVVEAGGKLNIGSSQIELNDFTLYSNFGSDKKPKSGQVDDPAKVHANGNAYFVLDLDSTGQASRGWYTFTVPFPVDELSGITRLGDNGEWQNIVNEQNYAVMDFHEELFAQGKSGWKKYTGILQPGRGYTMTIDCEINTYRFQMAPESAFNASMTQDLQTSLTGAGNKYIGWNNVGNGTMSYVNFQSAPSEYVQLFNHKDNTYEIVRSRDNTFVVGAAFFIQAASASSIVMEATDATSGMLRAPMRQHDNLCRVDLALAYAGKNQDNLFVTCSDDAQSEYTIGKDVVKMGGTTGASVARIWVDAKGTSLGAIDLAYCGNQVVLPLNIYAPKAGEYTLAMKSNPEDEVYLRQNGSIIWNMAMGNFTADLAAGTDNSYELLVIRHAPNITTGVDEIDSENGNNGTIFVEKMIVDDQLYILREGVLYDAQGRKVNNF